MEEYKKYLDLVYRYLTIRNRSEKEMRDYLTKKKIDAEKIEQVIQLLKKQKFLNDEVFARSWVVARARFRPKGKYLLKMELQQKGVAKDIIEKVLAEEDTDRPDELTQAKGIIERRMKKMQGKSRQEIYTKVGAFLARRGFGWEVIKKAIDQSLQESEE